MIQINLYFIGITLLLSSCGVKHYWIKNKEYESSFLTNKKITQTLFFLGDGGEPNPSITEPTLAMLDKLLKDTSQTSSYNQSVIFLGDNIYPVGLPSPNDPERNTAEKKLTEQLKIVKDHPGLKVMIPGNHDWKRMKKGGQAQLQYEQLFVENYFQDTSTFQPKNACPGPVKLDLTSNTLLLIMDSQWWLHNHEKPYGDTSNCDAKTEEVFLQKIQEIVDDNLNKNIFIACHHPLFTNGEHGGFFSITDHLFPLTSVNKSLYIPLPILGSIYPLARKVGLSNQDNTNRRYKKMINGLLIATKNHPKVIFVAGHEHNLELLKKNNIYQIVSGAASKSNPIKKGKDALFVARKKGLTKVDCYEDGSINIQFLTPDTESNPTLLYHHILK